MATLIEVAFIDDEDLLLENVAGWLARSGPGIAVVAAVQSIDELLSSDREVPPIVILDLRLRDGRPLEENIHRLVAAGATVVGCSTKNDSSWIREAIRCGANSYVCKSKDPSELRTAIEAAASGETYTSRAHAAAILDEAGPKLSIQQREALRLYVTGLSATQVADKMTVKAETIKGYLNRVREKYDEVGRPARSKIDLRQRAIEDGILVLPDTS